MPPTYIQYSEGVLVNADDHRDRVPAPSFNPAPETMVEVRQPGSEVQSEDGVKNGPTGAPETLVGADVAGAGSETNGDTSPLTDGTAAPATDAPAADAPATDAPAADAPAAKKR